MITGNDTGPPVIQWLSNGRYHLMVTSAGGGYSSWQHLTLTRWCDDPTCDDWGSFCYLRDVASGESWSTAFQPTLKSADAVNVVFSEGRAVLGRGDHGIEARMQIAIASG